MNINKTVHESGSLRLEIIENENDISVIWLGKSTDREPGKFLIPILTEAVHKAAVSEKIVIFDFCNLEYLNSSTITPIFRIVSKLDISLKEFKILFQKNIRWQVLNFSALHVLSTRDPRIEISGI